MIGIIGGNGLGVLNRTGVPGQAGVPTLGQTGERVRVNVVTGNVVLARDDEFLISHGPNLTVVRTYNAQGQLNDAADPTDHHWRWATRRLDIGEPRAGEPNTVARVASDGSRLVYRYDPDAACYRAVAELGQVGTATLCYDLKDAQWNWVDDSTGLTETYDSTGQLRSMADRNGNIQHYDYDVAGQLTRITMPNGDATYFDYIDGHVSQIRTQTSDADQITTLTRTHYRYDAQGRLTRVITDLTPGDNNIDDGQCYWTCYSYDGASDRVVRIEQQDGSCLNLTYENEGDVPRLRSVTDALGHTTCIEYDDAHRRTTMIDPQGNRSVTTYDAQGKITAIDGPGQQNRYGYDFNGNLTAITDAVGATIEFNYDAAGNVTWQRDATGRVTTRTYGVHHELLTETTQGHTTRYYYDERAQLRYQLSPAGRLTEYRYTPTGECNMTRRYLDIYPGDASDASAAVPTQAQLTAWVEQVGSIRIDSTETTFDTRGQPQSTIRIDPTDGTQSVTRTIYDPSGALRQIIDPDGNATSTLTDGLGRTIATTDALHRTTLTHYDDNGHRITTHIDQGVATTTLYDRSGRIVSTSTPVAMDTDASGTSAPSAGITRTTYDALGHLRMTEDPTGARTYHLYDQAGRLSADISAIGGVTEYRYNAAGWLTRTLRYATRIDTTRLTDSMGEPAALAIAALRPADSVADRSTWRVVDAAGRCLQTIDAEGYVTQIDDTSDATGSITCTTRYAIAIDTATLGDHPGRQAPFASADDRIDITFYDSDGLVRATLDAQGALIESRYDGAARLVCRIAYATPVEHSSSGTLSRLLAQAEETSESAPAHISRFFYDARGQKVAEIDPDGVLTQRRYDAAGQLIWQCRAGIPITQLVTPDTKLVDIIAAPSESDQVQQWRYDALGRIQETTQYYVASSVAQRTTFTYDAQGNLICRDVAQIDRADHAVNPPEHRSTQRQYNLQGQVTWETTDATATSNTYDAAGRCIATTDQNGNATRYFYQVDGQLRYAIDAAGDITETRTTVFGEIAQTHRYSTRLNATQLASLGQGGLLSLSQENAIAALLAQLSDSSVDANINRRFDRRGLVVAIETSLGTPRSASGNTNMSASISTVAYNAWSEATIRTDALAPDQVRATQTRYDAAGRIVDVLQGKWNAATGSIDRAERTEQQTQYDVFGRLTQTTDAAGQVTLYRYDKDDQGRAMVTTITDAAGTARTHVVVVDAFARTVRDIDAQGRETVTTYDAATNSMTLTTPEGSQTTTYQNVFGDTVDYVDSVGNRTRYRYDADGRLQATIQPDGTTTVTQKDALGNPIQTRVQDAQGHLIQQSDILITYDAASRITSRIVRVNGVEISRAAYRYDGQGRCLWQQDSQGIWTRTDYDAAGRVSARTIDPDALALRTEYRYDFAGNTITQVEGAGSAQSRVTTYCYDSLNRRIQTTLHQGDTDHITRFNYDAAGRLTAVIRTDGDGVAPIITRTVYDVSGQVVYSIDAGGVVTQRSIDALGHVISTRTFSHPIDAGAGLSLAATASDIAQRLHPDATQDRFTAWIYDGDRLRYQIDSLGQVTETRYDVAGRAVATVRLSTALDAAFLTRLYQDPAAIGVDDMQVAVSATPQDRISRTIYDVAGYAHYTIDSGNLVSETRRNALGQIIATVQYSTPYPPDETTHNAERILTEADLNAWLAGRSATAKAQDRSAQFAYDAAGRCSAKIDAAGYLTTTRYDALGNVIATTAYAQSVAAVQSIDPLTQTAIDAWIQAKDDHGQWRNQSADDRCEWHYFDAASRPIYSIDAQGYVSQMHYDALGRISATLCHNTPCNVSQGAPDIATLDAWCRTARRPNEDRLTRTLSDVTARLTYTIDAQGAVTRTECDANGNVTRIVRFAQTVALNDELSEQRDVALMNALSSGALGLNETDPQTAITSFVYDALGRCIRQTDAEGNITRTTYNSFGQATQVTVGADRPDATTTTWQYDTVGRKVRETRGAGSAVAASTTWTYTVFGDLAQETDPRGVAQATAQAAYAHTMTYDAMGRQTSVTDALGNVTQTQYNLFGDIIGIIDPRGHGGYFMVDARGKTIAHIDPEGGVTLNQYNAYGDVIRATRMTRRMTNLPQTTDLHVALDDAKVRDFIAQATDVLHDACITTRYDRLGRIIQKIDSENHSESTTYLNLSTQIHTDLLGGTTTTTFDRRGSVIQTQQRVVYAGKVDGDMVTRYSYDARGNRTTQIEQSAAGNRTTMYRYDRLDRKIATIGQARRIYDSNTGWQDNVCPTETLVLDARGNVIQKTDANGNTSWAWYDAANRADCEVTASGTLIQRRFDAVGNTLATTVYSEAIDVAQLKCPSQDFI